MATPSPQPDLAQRHFAAAATGSATIRRTTITGFHGSGPPQFSVVHSLRVSNDGMVHRRTAKTAASSRSRSSASSS
jgi:hypothetical protein